MANDLLVLIPIFFLIAMFYASAGFGGGSSYLAILALFSMEFVSVRIIALVCNIAVVSGSVWIFSKSGFLNIKKIIPLVLLSVPCAFIGGSMKISEHLFFVLLGCSLLIASFLMFFDKHDQKITLPRFSNAIIGGLIGLLSGLVGIGGGIFLSPVLYLAKWDTAKKIAAATTVFILVNSVAGLLGQLLSYDISIDPMMILALVMAVWCGGQIGARFTAAKADPITVKKITSLLIMLIAIRLLWKYIPMIL